MWPIYEKHEHAYCWRCEGPLVDHKPSLNPTGKYTGYCEDCDQWTFYDLVE
jgi:hypothetical protein